MRLHRMRKRSGEPNRNASASAIAKMLGISPRTVYYDAAAKRDIERFALVAWSEAKGLGFSDRLIAEICRDANEPLQALLLATLKQDGATKARVLWRHIKANGGP